MPCTLTFGAISTFSSQLATSFCFPSALRLFPSYYYFYSSCILYIYYCSTNTYTTILIRSTCHSGPSSSRKLVHVYTTPTPWWPWLIPAPTYCHYCLCSSYLTLSSNFTTTGTHFFSALPTDSMQDSTVHSPTLHALPAPCYDTFFSNIHHVRWYSQLERLIPILLPDTTLHNLINGDKDPASLLRSATHQLLLDQFQTKLPCFSPYFYRNHLSLRAVPISTALTSLPLHVASHRTPSYLFLSALKLKLAIPFLPHSCHCRCGGTMDPCGAHAFSCRSSNKTACHNRFRDTLYLLL